MFAADFQNFVHCTRGGKFDIGCAMVSSQLRLFCVMLLFCVLSAKITLISYRILVSDPLDFKLTVMFDK